MWFNDWVDVRKRKDSKGIENLELYLSFRNTQGSTSTDSVLGPIVTPYPTHMPKRIVHPHDGSVLSESMVPFYHIYPTKSLTFTQAKELKEAIDQLLGPNHATLIEHPFNVVQLHSVPHQQFKKLDESIQRQFLPGNLTAQARWRLGWPLRKVELHEILKDAVPRFNYIKSVVQDFFDLKKHQRLRSESFKEMERQAKSLSDDLRKLDPKNHILLSHQRKEIDIRLNSLKGIYFTNHHLDTNEFKNLTWCFIDTEKKFFAYDYAQNCHVAIMYKFPNGAIQGEVHTTMKSNEQMIHAALNGTNATFTMKYYRSELEMVQGAVKSISNVDPAVLLAHNIPYDLNQLKSISKTKRPGFRIGLGKSSPITKVSLDFFKRMDVKGKVVIDTHRLARILEPHLPAFDLETVAGLDKSLTYQMFDALSRKDEPDSNLLLSSYVAHDVLALYHHVFHGPWKDRIQPILTAAKVLGVSVSKSSHSPSCAEKLRDRQFFEDSGTYRASKSTGPIYVKMKKKFAQGWPARRDRFFSSFRSSAPVGRYENVHRLYLPLEKVMMARSGIEFPWLGDLYKDWDSLTNKDRLTICQYMGGLNTEPWVRWFQAQIHQKSADKAAKEAKLSYLILSTLDQGFWSQYARNKYQKQPDKNLDLIKTHFGDQGFAHDTRRALDNLLKVREVSRRFNARYHCSLDVWESTASRYGSYLADAIKHSGSIVIHRHGQWLFLKGGLPDDPLAPIIPIDECTVIKFNYKGDNKLLFKERGKYHGIKLNPKKPSNLSVFEATILTQVIDGLLDGDSPKACLTFEEGLADLCTKRVAKQDLLFNIPGQPLAFQGVDSKTKDTVFTYAQRDEGLLTFNPCWEFYENRYQDVVGGWLKTLDV